MKKLAIAVAGILAVGTLAVAPMAAAAPTGGSNAADTVKTLRDMGYNVQLNGTVAGPLSQCIATGVHGLSNSDPTVFTTAYVDISCPASDD
ncbi:MAG: hypothetical protein QOD36_383 [Mycobacterium sp.]|jgi:hypothetical protein|nr:hypothetical protein [Mycobacterium sp.]MDT5243007.1 hypothetical protein [Mycobacterium sp.]MDT5332359.1 hypothetical protein [Mycobacterium sp.]